jgi:FAD/FMN-containing dehydrogenase
MSLKRLRDLFEFTPALRKTLARRLLADVPARELQSTKAGSCCPTSVRSASRRWNITCRSNARSEVLREVIRRIERDARPTCSFPIEARIIAPDDAWLSPVLPAASGSIAVHAWYKEDHDWMFRLIEPVFREAGGRPHWGKLHSLGARNWPALPDVGRGAGRAPFGRSCRAACSIRSWRSCFG